MATAVATAVATASAARRRLRALTRHVAPAAATTRGGSTIATVGSVADAADGQQLPLITLAEVATHRSRASAWVALHGDVYDFTNFLDSHPGGSRSLLRLAGQDASEEFTELHSQSIFAAFAPRFKIGRLHPADR